MNIETPRPKNLPRWEGKQRRIGLTGGIASGKSSVGRFLKDVMCLPVLDADLYAKDVLAPNTTSTKEVIERYGNSIAINRNGISIEINRSALARIIFSNPNERLWLEQLIHPLVLKRLKIELNSLQKDPTIALNIPLLFEGNFTDLCSEFWCVDCTLTQQCTRLMKRDMLTRNEAYDRINAQWSLQYKKQLSDVVIDNSREAQAWIPDIKKLFQ